jgi:hypothetical protein
MNQPSREQLEDALDYMGWIRNVASDWPDIEENVGLLAAGTRSYLALVEGPTDEQVEAAAKALYEQQPQVKDGSWPEWVDLRSAALSHWKNVARTALQAALRIEEPE